MLHFNKFKLRINFISMLYPNDFNELYQKLLKINQVCHCAATILLAALWILKSRALSRFDLTFVHFQIMPGLPFLRFCSLTFALSLS